MPELALIEQLAFDLSTGFPSQELAFLIDGNAVYFSTVARKRHEPNSAIVQLIQGTHETHPRPALRILRKRIFATGAPTEMCHGMVSVAAKRLTAGILPRNHGIKLHQDKIKIGGPAPERVEAPPTERRSDPDFMQLALELARKVPRQGPLRGLDRPVAALLVSADGRVLAQAVNSSSRNRTLHAEVRLIQGFWHRSGIPLPRDCRIYTTLKPCKMCAGMIWEASEDVSTLQVLYAERDDGPMARLTVLDPSTHERRRACRNPGLPPNPDLPIQRQLGPGFQGFQLNTASCDARAECTRAKPMPR